MPERSPRPGISAALPQFRKSYCEDCGAPAIYACEKCGWPIAGISEHAWMAGGGPYRRPRYCGECGTALPWTETALKTAKEFTDNLEELSPEEKIALKQSLDDLTTDTPRTPVAASRFKKLVDKVGPAAGGVLKKAIETVVSEAAKKSISLTAPPLRRQSSE